MADKRFYWLKLKEDYFNTPRIKKLRKIAGGDTYTIIYLKMQLLSIKTEGYLTYEGIEPTFEEELALKLDEDLENIKLTLSYLNSQQMLEQVDNNQFAVLDAQKSIGSESQSAERVRAFRERQEQKALPREPKSNALRQRQFKAKELCKKEQHIPLIEDYINNKRYNGNYYLVFKRDKMCCAICGSKENLCVHHIDGFDENKPENNNENKMITLCRECHSNIHSGNLSIPEEVLNSIDYYESNESNNFCNTLVTNCNTEIEIEKDIELELDKELEQEEVSKYQELFN